MMQSAAAEGSAPAPRPRRGGVASESQSDACTIAARSSECAASSSRPLWAAWSPSAAVLTTLSGRQCVAFSAPRSSPSSSSGAAPETAVDRRREGGVGERTPSTTTTATTTGHHPWPPPPGPRPSDLPPPHGRGGVALARSHVGAEFVHGALAAFCNIALTFPLNKLISRQTYESLSAREALATMRHDLAHGGLGRLYRGVAPPLAQRTVSMGTMYGMFDFWFAQIYSCMGHGGGGGGGVGAEDGGAGAGILLATDVPNGAPGVWPAKAAAAVIAGCFEALLTPFERVQTLLQHRRYTHVFVGTMDATRAVAAHGLRESYRGFTAVAMRNGPANAMFFTLRDPARDVLPSEPPAVWPFGSGGAGAGPGAGAGAGAGPGEEGGAGGGRNAGPSPSSSNNGAWSLARDFLSGAVLGSAISTLIYPITTVKNVMQLDMGADHPHLSMRQACRLVLAERGGVRGLYRGAAGNAARALLSWGVTNSAYEVAKRHVAVTGGDRAAAKHQ